MPARLHIGMSGWTYDHWLGRFYPDKAMGESRLRQYARSFRSVEINGTPYKMPTEAAMRAWLAETPEDFTFAIKTGRFITHRKRLKAPRDPHPDLLRPHPHAGAQDRRLPRPAPAELPGRPAPPPRLLGAAAVGTLRLRVPPRQLVDRRDLRLPRRAEPRLHALPPRRPRDARDRHRRLDLYPPARPALAANKNAHTT